MIFGKDRGSIHNTGDNPWFRSTAFKHSFKRRAIINIRKKPVVFVCLVSQTKAVKIRAVLPNDCRSTCQPLSARTEMIFFTKQCLILFQQLLGLRRAGYRHCADHKHKHQNIAHFFNPLPQAPG